MFPEIKFIYTLQIWKLRPMRHRKDNRNVQTVTLQASVASSMSIHPTPDKGLVVCIRWFISGLGFIWFTPILMQQLLAPALHSLSEVTVAVSLSQPCNWNLWLSQLCSFSRSPLLILFGSNSLSHGTNPP